MENPRNGSTSVVLDPEALRALLLERASLAGVTADTDEARIEALLARDLAVPDPTVEECACHYERHRSRYVSDALVEASHILFAVVPGVHVEPILAQAQGTLAYLRSHPDDFARSAAEFSNCPSGRVGGSLGQLAPGDVVPELRAALFETGHAGILPELIRSRHGLHILRVDRRHAGRQIPFEQVADRIAAELVAQSWTSAAVHYVERLQHEHAAMADVDPDREVPA